MIDAAEIDLVYSLTDGDIALNNLESARRNSWSRFWRDPLRPGIAECIVEQEQFTLRFTGDVGVLDRLEELAGQLDRVDAESSRSGLIQAQVASTAHRFAEARRYLERIAERGELAVEAEHLALSIDQACGTNLDAVQETRQRMATESGRLEDLVPLGALQADVRNFDEANQLYERALRDYQGASPFAVAWVCFQLGMLWGELVPELQLTRAAAWYEQAIRYLPGYVKARVHLAEIYLRSDLASKAEALLLPSLPSGDPEVSWRLSEALIALGRNDEAQERMCAARSGFDFLVGRHALAFADHGAEFYAGSGNDPQRAFALASMNLANRPLLRAFEQAYETARAAGRLEDAAIVLRAARGSWGGTNAFRLSALAGI